MLFCCSPAVRFTNPLHTGFVRNRLTPSSFFLSAQTVPDTSPHPPAGNAGRVFRRAFLFWVLLLGRSGYGGQDFALAHAMGAVPHFPGKRTVAEFFFPANRFCRAQHGSAMRFSVRTCTRLRPRFCGTPPCISYSCPQNTPSRPPPSAPKNRGTADTATGSYESAQRSCTPTPPGTRRSP